MNAPITTNEDRQVRAAVAGALGADGQPVATTAKKPRVATAEGGADLLSGLGLTI